MTLLEDDPEGPAVYAIVVAGGIGTLILLSPVIASLLFGRRGLAQGDARAKAPMIVAGVTLVVVLAQGVLGAVASLL